MTDQEDRDERAAALEDELRDALGADEVRFEITWAIALGGTRIGDGLRVEYKNYGQKRWSRVKTAVFPGEDQSTTDVFRMLYDIRVHERERRDRRG